MQQYYSILAVLVQKKANYANLLHNSGYSWAPGPRKTEVRPEAASHCCSDLQFNGNVQDPMGHI